MNIAAGDCLMSAKRYTEFIIYPFNILISYAGRFNQKRKKC